MLVALPEVGGGIIAWLIWYSLQSQATSVLFGGPFRLLFKLTLRAREVCAIHTYCLLLPQEHAQFTRCRLENADLH